MSLDMKGRCHGDSTLHLIAPSPDFRPGETPFGISSVIVTLISYPDHELNSWSHLLGKYFFLAIAFYCIPRSYCNIIQSVKLTLTLRMRVNVLMSHVSK